MRDYFIGVDGGGTKTRFILEDREGRFLAEAMSGPGNIRSSLQGSWQSVMNGVSQLLNQAGLQLNDPHTQFHIGLGLAGTEIPDIAEAFKKHPHPFASLVLASDAYAACLGVHDGQDGSIIIVGTGVIGYQIEHDVISRVGGFGFPHDDLGGGAWLGLRATQLTLQSLDGRGPTSGLTQAIFQHFHEDQIRLITWANSASPGDFGTLAPIVIHESKKNEPSAVGLLQEAAQYINRLDQALLKKTSGAHPLPCCLLGGIAPFLEPYLSPELIQRTRPRVHDAAKGALFMIRKHILGSAK